MKGDILWDISNKEVIYSPLDVTVDNISNVYMASNGNRKAVVL